MPRTPRRAVKRLSRISWSEMRRLAEVKQLEGNHGGRDSLWMKGLKLPPVWKARGGDWAKSDHVAKLQPMSGGKSRNIALFCLPLERKTKNAASR